ncbi:MAG: SurA N-terminal domain-containing protein [Alphaproteobacteria bacterium]|nr:SurA N-terminal domain-containing protein [Alphaproteobacteria bacterium]
MKQNNRKKLRTIVALMIGTATFASGFVLNDFAISLQSVEASTQQIVAVVNEDAISQSDFDKRLKLIIASSELPDNKEIRQRVTPQIIGSLIDEQLMIQEARNMNIEVADEEITQGFATIAQQNKMSPDQFEKMLRQGGIDVGTLRRQIHAQIAWSKVVQKRLRPRVVVSDQDIDSALERMRSKIGTKEFLAAEIYLPFDDAKSEAQTKNLANRLSREIKSGKTNFFKVAQQFSKGAGATKGGDTGWLNEEQINPDILSALKNIRTQQISNPVKLEDGYYIMFLRETRDLTEDKLPSRQQIEYNIGNERLERLQRRHLIDLKASSFIDIRV